MEYSRREFGKLVLAGLPATTLSLKSSSLAAAAKPDSKWAGVQIGMNVPYNFGTGNYTPGDEIIQRTAVCDHRQQKSQKALFHLLTLADSGIVR